MTRAEWLNAIRLKPDCETTRLAFADWLDENGTGDLDAATVEFVRASCRGVPRNSTQMARPAYKWLEENWHRLVPTLNANHGAAYAAAQQPTAAEAMKILNWRAGRRIGTTVYLRRRFSHDEYANRNSSTLPFARDHLAVRAVLEFWKGFLLFFATDVRGRVESDALAAAVKRDQPLAVECGYDAYGNARQPAR